MVGLAGLLQPGGPAVCVLDFVCVCLQFFYMLVGLGSVTILS